MARSFLARLSATQGQQVVTLSRKKGLPDVLDSSPLNQCFSTANFLDLLSGVDVVVHTAARAHVLNETATDPLAEYRKVNVDFTLNLARQCAQSQVKRFIYISSIGVHGVTSDRPFTVCDVPAPEEPYAISKIEAERGLENLCQTCDMELVIIRPPLVYGREAPGNFARMVGWISSGIPLPLGAVDNRRSLISIDNLADLILVCLDHPLAAGKILLASDGEDVSTSDLLRRVARAMGKPARLVPFPTTVLRVVAGLTGKKSMVRRLTSSLQVDMSSTTTLLGWTPPFTLDESLARCFESPDERQ
ncbi:NAD-dependent epimerase/dehydratase family protein [Pseudomonas protegens]|nr:NAD-dependent epimerase/dehydratase family protein [Pseudomonas protegens]MBP5133584.1 NAD-dependent epimerase/dehydratase family protein [Pseudomonas protegens]MBP5150801.1 NAD-dependent epimerase/dehydratase family protein [Pseudomonas protegens]MBP5150915.1 NAD-dependent epimerase/dehydratase family protein [Pseudomonas protegens]